ncbi:MAG TPA: MarR family transcriptional regulator [Acidobacteriaceae bacterium]|jgi:DNA-binding MarR family transcriptional regulator|nr:MarR family transcriptional regulator [Acidobacteriaceae bacterium]
MDFEKLPQGAFSAFLLAQVGAHAAKRFGERLEPLGITPPQAGILRMLARAGGLSQRDLAERLGIHPSRLVSLLDDMETAGLVVREANAEDRRLYSLQLTAAGRERMGELGRVARQHNEELCSALTVEERVELASLLDKIAQQQGLTPGVHPGYSSMGKSAGDGRAGRERKR